MELHVACINAGGRGWEGEAANDRTVRLVGRGINQALYMPQYATMFLFLFVKRTPRCSLFARVCPINNNYDTTILYTITVTYYEVSYYDNKNILSY